MVRIQEVKGRHSLSLPVQIARIKGWKKGDDLFFNVDSRTGKVMVEKIEDATKI